MYENYLAHYGVKGMKWGQRRYGVGRQLNKLAKRKDQAGKATKRLNDSMREVYNPYTGRVEIQMPGSTVHAYQKAINKFNKQGDKLIKKYNAKEIKKPKHVTTAKGKKILEHYVSVNGNTYTYYVKDWSKA